MKLQEVAFIEKRRMHNGIRFVMKCNYGKVYDDKVDRRVNTVIELNRKVKDRHIFSYDGSNTSVAFTMWRLTKRYLKTKGITKPFRVSKYVPAMEWILINVLERKQHVNLMYNPVTDIFFHDGGGVIHEIYFANRAIFSRYKNQGILNNGNR